MHWRIRELLVRQGPRLLLLASAGVVSWLVLTAPPATVPGYAEVAPVRLASLETGRLEEILVKPGQLLTAGDVIARLDGAPLDARARVLQAELARSGVVEETAVRDAEVAASEAMSLKRQTQAELTAAEQALSIASDRLERRRAQVTAGLETRDSLAPLQARVAELRGEVSGLRARLTHTRQVAEGSKPGAGGTSEAAVVREELAMLRLRQRELTLRAPLDARAGAVHYRPGELLPQHAVLAELLPLETTTVVACVPEHFAQRVEAGGPVALYPVDSRTARTGIVVDVSGLISEAPDRCKQRVNEIGWVRPVRIAVEGEGLVPGQRFDISFLESVEEAS